MGSGVQEVGYLRQALLVLIGLTSPVSSPAEISPGLRFLLDWLDSADMLDMVNKGDARDW